jgi:glycosyltransferase involved in cell wall biosynthesis
VVAVAIAMLERLNVAIVAPSMGILGGQAVQASRLLRSWENDPEVRAWLVPINPPPPHALTFSVRVKYLRTLVTQLGYWPSLARELRRADVVHVFSASYSSFLLAPLPAVLVAKLYGKPVVMNYRSGEASDHLARSAVARRTLRCVDANAVPSRFLRDVFTAHGVTSDVIPNVVDAKRFRFRPREPLRPRVLSTRNFEPLYNVPCTLRAFRLIQDSYPDATLTLVGAGSMDAALRQLAGDLRLRHVAFAGRVPPDEIWRYYAEADIYLQTPDIDNMPSSVLEAFASGCPVVSTKAGGVPAILADQLHGLLVPCGDAHAAGNAVMRLLAEPGLARRLADAALNTCATYQWSSVRGQWIALYRRIVRPRGRRDVTGMKPRTFLGRVAAMDAEESRARLTRAARTGAGRVRFALSRPRWERERLLTALHPASGPLIAAALAAARRGEWLAAHQALATHVQTRASRWPLKSAHRSALSAGITRACSGAVSRARQAADRILDGHLDLLGYRDVVAGNPPAWHRDPVHARSARRVYWADVPYLDPAIGDHKVVWEINRHQHFLTLGTAYWLTHDARYRDVFVTHLEDWLRENPPLTGINWASMLELAFRALSWTWAVEFFAAGAAGDTSPWLVDLLVALDVQLSHIANNLSTYFSPNTHLSGEALALYAVSTAFPELRRSSARAATGRAVLLRESERQVLGDGGHAELSAHYHRYSTDFYLLACLIARAAGDDAAAAFERTAHRQASFLRTIADDEGRLPLIGDDDGGRLFRFSDRPAWDASTTLSVSASVLSDVSLAVRPADTEVFWILGERPEGADPGTRRITWRSRLLAESGYFVSRSSGGNHLVFDAGPHGFLNGGHAHSDALSVDLTVRGRPLLIDPGTATYTIDRSARDRYRSARMHNTVVIDGCDPSIPAGPFRWRSRADARVLVARTSRELDFAAGAICGRGGVHVRAIVTLHGTGWLIVDRIVTTAPVTAEAWWHLHPMWHAHGWPGGVMVQSDDRVRLGLAFNQADVCVTRDPEIADVSLEYGRRELGTAIRVRHQSGRPFVMACFVAEAPLRYNTPRVGDVDSRAASLPGWTRVALAIELDGAPGRTVELHFPDTPEAQPDQRWPQPCIRAGRAKEIAVCAE